MLFRVFGIGRAGNAVVGGPYEGLDPLGKVAAIAIDFEAEFSVGNWRLDSKIELLGFCRLVFTVPWNSIAKIIQLGMMLQRPTVEVLNNLRCVCKI